MIHPAPLRCTQWSSHAEASYRLGPAASIKVPDTFEMHRT
jgi:hypothetical protein